MNMVENAIRPASAMLRYGFAIAFVALALGLTFFLQSVVSIAGFLFFYIAVVASAWFGGKWPGGIAVILSILAVEYFFMAPVHSFGINRESLPIFIEFAISALVVGWFSSWRKQTEAELQQARDTLQMRVEERTVELKQRNEQLVAEMAERKRAESAYYEAQAELARVTRLSTLGALAASISHEVNQPLAAVVTNADACMMWLSSASPNLEEARSAVDSIAREGTRASEVVRRIRAMFTKASPERAPVAINDLIRDVDAMLQTEASRNQVTLISGVRRRSSDGAGRPGAIATGAGQSGPKRHRSDERHYRSPAARRVALRSSSLQTSYWSRSRTPVSESTPRTNGESSMHSSPPNPKEWVWASPSASPSSRPMQAVSGPARTAITARRFNSLCRPRPRPRS